MPRIRLLSPYPLVTDEDGRAANPPLVVDAPAHAAAQLIAASLAEEADAEVDGVANFAGFGDPEPPAAVEAPAAAEPEAQPEPPADGEETDAPAAGKRRKG